MFKCFFAVVMISGQIYGGDWEFQNSEIPGFKTSQFHNNILNNMNSAVDNIREIGLEKISEFTLVNEADIDGRFYGCYETTHSSKMVIGENLLPNDIEKIKELVDEIYFD